MHVFADIWLADPKNWLTILQVALGLGFVIFVHELGHFAVAKLCGVKCEKFYLGFDIGGLKIWSFRYGETEYGIGILPLGGYVKMLGQDDNPARAADEVERSRLKPPDSVAGGDLPAEPTESTPPVHDPRSYLAQSVPERMAIISAGVIMNLIFAVIMAAIAYGIGVQELAATWVSEVVPGEAAWQADMRPGDKILSINGIENPRFRDLKIGVALADREDGVHFVLQRPGEEPREAVIRPDRDKSKGQLMPRIGIGPPLTLTLYAKHPYLPRGPVGQTDKLQDRDKIVAINGEPVEHHAELLAQLARHPAETLSIEVERTADGDQEAGEDTTAARAQRVKVDVKPNPHKRLGLVMTMGEITAIQENSPAAQAGLKPGDAILRIDGEPPGDPLTLPERLRQKAGQTVVVEVSRGDNRKPLAIDVLPRDPDWYETTIDNGPYSAPALGIAYAVTSKVREVVPGSPAAERGIKPGAVITSARFISPEGAELDAEEAELLAKPVEFSDEKLNWPAFITALQWRLPGTSVELTLAEGTPVTVKPYDSDAWYPDRGFFLYPRFETRTAKSVGDALSLGLHETKDLSLQVFRFLGALGTGRVSPKNLGGPGTIAVAAADSAQAGLPAFLIFLTMLSANLAVINFLPIPVLDGGHMVFLTLEGIRGKPLSDRMVIWATYLGFAFVLGLMIFVIVLDIEKLLN